MEVRRRRARAGLVLAACRPPAPFDPAGVDPEEALAASLASRPTLFFLDFARRIPASLVV
jgi:hypothetical protein